MDSNEIISTKRNKRNTHKTNKRIQEQKQGEAEPNWINMTEDFKNDFLEAVAKMHNIELKQATVE